MGDRILYHGGYKYQLAQPYAISTAIRPRQEIDHPFFRLRMDGRLELRHGYAWDGPSGPTVDTRNSMRGSLVHDVLYQAMHRGWLDRKWREEVDDLFRQILIEDGMSRFRAWLWHRAVRRRGDNVLDKPAKEVRVAPW